MRLSRRGHDVGPLDPVMVDYESGKLIEVVLKLAEKEESVDPCSNL